MKDKLMEDLKEAMKNKNIIAKNTIQGIRAEILKEEKDKQKVLDNCEIENIIMKEQKKRIDLVNQLEQYPEREEAKNQALEEIAIISKYLPEPISKEELIISVRETINELNINDMKQMGVVIKSVKEQYGNRVNGKVLSEIVKQCLGGN